MAERPTVGVIGLGLVGTALARRLIGAGFEVVGTDIDPAARTRLAELGGRAAPSALEVARSCSRIVIAVLNTEQVEAVTEGVDGLVAAVTETVRRIALVASTCDPERMAALAGRLKPQGIDLLEIPLSGSSDQVARGEAIAFVGGEESTLDESADILNAIAKASHFMGAAGAGGRTKLAVNLILGLNRAALAEGLVYAERMGLALPRFLDVARGSAAYSQIMDIKGDKMVAADFTPQGKIAQSLKDFALILESAAAAGQKLPLADVYRNLMHGCVAHGEADWDNCAVIREIRRARQDS